MNTGFALIITGEVALFLFLLYGFLHEDKFIAWEDKVIAAAKQKRAVKNARKRSRINAKVCYTPERPTHKSASGNRVA